ncbi:MAG: hypothetical protein J0L56_05860 [Chitinophagales bacterium]|nr:hypothetical protein [Chitinophagales bacterium]
MNVRNTIWYDFLNAKFGGEYLILYLKRERKVKKWFKILTIIFSAGGIFSAFKDFKIPTIIMLSAIGVVQIASLLEEHIMHSENDMQQICKLRLMYLDWEQELEKLFSNYESMTEETAKGRLFELRESSKKIEELDNKINIRIYKSLKDKTDQDVRNYINTYYPQ